MNEIKKKFNEKKLAITNYNKFIKNKLKLFKNDPKKMQEIIDTISLVDYDFDFNLYADDYLFNGCISFKVFLSMKCIEKNQNEYFRIFNALACKDLVRYFLDLLDIKYLGNKIPVNKNQLTIEEKIVIKPINMSTSRHCYLVHSSVNIEGLNPPIVFNDVGTFINQLPDKLYLIEPLIQNDNNKAINIKFYTFYGIIGCIFYMYYKGNKKIKEYYNINGNLDHLTNKLNIDPDMVNEVIRISLEIPIEFIRIDYIVGNHKYYFGEFTLKPGTFSNKNKYDDYILGKYFLDAKERLFKDMLNGKQFEIFNKFIKIINDNKYVIHISSVLA